MSLAITQLSGSRPSNLASGLVVVMLLNAMLLVLHDVLLSLASQKLILSLLLVTIKLSSSESFTLLTVSVSAILLNYVLLLFRLNLIVHASQELIFIMSLANTKSYISTLHTF